LLFVLSLYFQRVNGLSALSTGLAFVPVKGAVFATNLVAARTAKRIGVRWTIAVGAALMAGGCAALLGLARGGGMWSLTAQFIALGAGLGLLVPPLTSALSGSVEKKQSGVASGVL
jgi:DHA2 family methylenomycin A resistance protein-like MFS transporter